ncbi:MAG: FAD:protein FMN transferase [Desulfatiglandales bacterium]
MEIMDHLSRQCGAMNRRSFLKFSGILGLGVASTGLMPLTAEAVRFDRNLHKVSKTRLAMGTVVSMTLIHSSRDQAEEAMGQAFREIDRLTGLMNRFDDATAVGHLNREGYLNDLPPEVAQVIARSLDYYRISQGTFDITVKPVVDLFKMKFQDKDHTPPTERELNDALKLVDAGSVQMNGRRVSFGKPGMGITLDGIAKGYIVDRASRILSDGGIKNHLINAGGDIRTSGEKADKKPWTVAIQDPKKEKDYPDTIQMRDGAIATSGNYEVFFDREKMFHHIVNPRTGLSPQLNTSVSVLARTAMDADALSTTVFVMAPQKGIQFIDNLPRCECFIVADKGKILKSTGWKGSRS